MVRRPVLVAAVALAVLLSGCGKGEQVDPGAKAGVVNPVVLTLGAGNSSAAPYPAIREFIDQVKARTEGRVVVELEFFDLEGDTKTPGTGRDLVDGVASGSWDLGWIGAQSMSEAGAPAFDALEAPMLIDDYAVQRAVLTSDVPARLLATTTPLGVEGLAILGDHLRVPFGATKPLAAPADFKGAEVWADRAAGGVHRATITALGGTPTDRLFRALSAGVLDGSVAGLVSSANNMSDNGLSVEFMTVNEKLWPRAILLMANPASLAALGPADADAVRAAAKDAVTVSLTVGPTSDAEQLALMCGGGTRAVVATDAQLAAMRKAVEPVYTDLRKDALTAAILDRISELKAGVTPEPVAVPAECFASTPVVTPSALPVPPRPTAAPTVFDGTYRQVITAADLTKAGFSEQMTAKGDKCMTADSVQVNCLIENAGTFTYVFDKGSYTWEQRQAGVKISEHGSGYYVVHGDVLTIVDDLPRDDGTPFVTQLRWSEQGGTVTVVPMDDTNVSAIAAASAWHKIS